MCNSSRYLDNLQGLKEEIEGEDEVRFNGELDRVYCGAPDIIEVQLNSTTEWEHVDDVAHVADLFVQLRHSLGTAGALTGHRWGTH